MHRVWAWMLIELAKSTHYRKFERKRSKLELTVRRVLRFTFYPLLLIETVVDRVLTPLLYSVPARKCLGFMLVTVVIFLITSIVGKYVGNAVDDRDFHAVDVLCLCSVVFSVFRSVALLPSFQASAYR